MSSLSLSAPPLTLPHSLPPILLDSTALFPSQPMPALPIPQTTSSPSPALPKPQPVLSLLLELSTPQSALFLPSALPLTTQATPSLLAASSLQPIPSPAQPSSWESPELSPVSCQLCSVHLQAPLQGYPRGQRVPNKQPTLYYQPFSFTSLLN